MADRRTIIRGIFGLAAIAAAPGTLQAMASSDRDRLMAQMRDNGVVAGQTFVIEDRCGIVLEGINGLHVSNCSFIWINGLHPSEAMFSILNCTNCLFSSCTFDTKGGAMAMLGRLRTPSAASYAPTAPA
jgi:hypothetical protein